MSIKCEICGSNNIIKQGGVYVCGKCGVRYSLQEVQKMFSSSIEDKDGDSAIYPTSSPTPSASQMKQANAVPSRRVPDNFTFGNYGTAIEWVVVKRQNGMIQAISRYAIDAQPIDKRFFLDPGANWETSELNVWLNNDFLKQAFSSKQCETIKSCGDQAVSLLSREEAQTLPRSVMFTHYTQFAYTRSTVGLKNEFCPWWTKSIINHEDSSRGIVVNQDGSFAEMNLAANSYGIRPVLCLQESILASLLFSSQEETSYSLKVGSMVDFGKFYINSDAYREPIKWLVIKVEGSKALLLSEKALVPGQYDKGDKKPNWKDCTARTWLNHDFLSVAFSSKEQECIIPTTLCNKATEGNPSMAYPDDNGEDTIDRIFLLSHREAFFYCQPSTILQAKPTKYAVSIGIYTNRENGNCAWVLRTTVLSGKGVSGINSRGNASSDKPDNRQWAIRPALWLDLKKFG